MLTKNERAERIIASLVQQVANACHEIIGIMDDGADELDLMLNVGSSYGLEVWAKDRATPVVVPDGWVNDWAIFCGGNKAFVVEKARDLCRWSLDNQPKRKTEKNLRRWMGGIIARDWKAEMAARPVASGSLRGYDRRHGGA